MTVKQNKLPSVLLLILSALGILFGFFSAGVSLADGFLFSRQNITHADLLSALFSASMGITIALLNMPTLVTSINKLAKKSYKKPEVSLLRLASILIILWFFFLVIGYVINRTEKWTAILALLTTAAVIIPVFWLVEFGRKGLPRSTKMREWGTLTIGLTVAPAIIILTEIFLIMFAVVAIIIGLRFQGEISSSSFYFFKYMRFFFGGINESEHILYELMRQPLIAVAVFLILGLIAPLIEEIFKPMAAWFLLNRPLHEYEGFSLGLISGGGFAMLENSGVIIQMQAQDWLAAIALRTATGVLHVGLSGLVGYGLVRSWNEKHPARGIFYIIAAALLHGAWNSLALYSGLSSPFAAEEILITGSDTGNIVSIALMNAIFIGIVLITLRINKQLRKSLAAKQADDVENQDK